MHPVEEQRLTRIIFLVGRPTPTCTLAFGFPLGSLAYHFNCKQVPCKDPSTIFGGEVTHSCDQGLLMTLCTQKLLLMLLWGTYGMLRMAYKASTLPPTSGPDLLFHWGIALVSPWATPVRKAVGHGHE